MNPLIDKKMVETIRATGNPSEDLPERTKVMEEYGLPYDRKAENVVVSGCQIMAADMFQPKLASLARIFDQTGFSYTFLSKEYCCGNLMYRPAVKARDEEAIAECRELSREFLAGNLEQAKSLGAKRLVVFCSPCYPIYKHAFPKEDIVFFPKALSEVMGAIKLDDSIDYYAGCYRLHRKFSPAPMDLKSTDEVFSNMEGLKVNRISAPKCCYHPEGLAHMIGQVKTKTMVHICTGCYGQALTNMPPEKDAKVLMLPELVEQALNQ